MRLATVVVSACVLVSIAGTLDAQQPTTRPAAPQQQPMPRRTSYTIGQVIARINTAIDPHGPTIGRERWYGGLGVRAPN